MFNNKLNSDKGFIKLLILVVIAIVILSYFNFDLRSIIESPQSQQNFSYAGGAVSTIWSTYLKAPANFLWNTVFIGILWNSFVHNMQKIDSGTPTTIQELGQKVIDGVNKSVVPAN